LQRSEKVIIIIVIVAAATVNVAFIAFKMAIRLEAM